MRIAIEADPIDGVADDMALRTTICAEVSKVLDRLGLRARVEAVGWSVPPTARRWVAEERGGRDGRSTG